MVEITTERDWLLQLLVRLANSTDLELGLTLSTGGLVVSGTLVSGATYFEGVIQSFNDLGPAAESLQEGFQEIRKDVYGEGGKVESDEEGPGYIHLRAAKWWDPAGHSMPGAGIWWRGRISAIDFFVFGTFGPKEGTSDS